VAGAGDSEPVVNLKTDLIALGIGEEVIPRFFHALREGAYIMIADVPAAEAADVHDLLAGAGAEFLV
jgi:hypothetical protein